MKIGNKKNHVLLYLLLILFGINMAFFFTYRYGGQWMENDTLTLDRMIIAMQSQRILTPFRYTYQHGYLFQVISVLLSDLSGINIKNLLTLLYPYISISFLISSAWYFYYQATEDMRIALLAILFLCLQADVLFVIFRGSHEKLDWSLIMISLALFFSSLNYRGIKQAFHIILFYLISFAFISVNVYFASTFLTALLFALLIGLGVHNLHVLKKESSIESPHRLFYITLSMFILLFVFMAYLYSPALNNLQASEDIYQKIRLLFLSPELATQPYDYISFGWINTVTYLGVSIFTWLLIISSMLIWLWRGWRLVKGKDVFGLKNTLDWLLYAGFALQVGFSIIIDIAGVLSSNMQLRVFPGFTIMAVLLLSKGLIRFFSEVSFRPGFQLFFLILLLVLIAWLPIAALFKASNEPILSNKWMIYSENEIQAVNWSTSHLRNTSIWTGIDERIRDAYIINYNLINNNNLQSYSNYRYIRHIVLSEKEVLRAERIGFALPPVSGWMQLYDNGNVKFLKKPPLTPFQR